MNVYMCVEKWMPSTGTSRMHMRSLITLFNHIPDCLSAVRIAGAIQTATWRCLNVPAVVKYVI